MATIPMTLRQVELINFLTQQRVIRSEAKEGGRNHDLIFNLWFPSFCSSSQNFLYQSCQKFLTSSRYYLNFAEAR